MTNTSINAEEPALDGCNDDEEEFWPTPSLLTVHKVHTIRFGAPGGKEPRILRYKSMPSEELTPLDMTYGKRNGNEDDPFRDDEFYDGTGNLMWMAAICFGHLVFQEVEPLRSYLLHGSPSTKGEKNSSENNKRRKFCELGCGTGGAGISLLLSALESDENAVESTNCHVVFTDNDAESLELCASNCELNGLDRESYSHRLLGWGREHLEKTRKQEGENVGSGGGLDPYSFDVVFATDVIYDLKMIAPLFETVEFLLKKKKSFTTGGENDNNGKLVLSHVPRFCIPKDNSDNQGTRENDQDEDPHSEAFLELEHFIQSEANKVGLVLVESIRPHHVLSEEILSTDPYYDEGENDNDDDSMQQLTLESMKEAHAVVFVFERS